MRQSRGRHLLSISNNLNATHISSTSSSLFYHYILLINKCRGAHASHTHERVRAFETKYSIGRAEAHTDTFKSFPFCLCFASIRTTHQNKRDAKNFKFISIINKANKHRVKIPSNTFSPCMCCVC